VGTPPATGTKRSGLAHPVIATDRGTVEADPDLAKAPCAAASLSFLAGKKFFDNTACHRVTTGPLYAVYCGDPSGTDQGGPAYRVLDENIPNGQRPAYPAGSILLVNHGPNTNASEFGLVYQASDIANPTFPVIGQITSGLPLLVEVGTAGEKDQAFEAMADTSLPGLGGGHPKPPLTVKSLTITRPAG
jgi:peptidyl-prolyl cis-trans isomerase B (cyclophilin B)